MDAAHHIAFRVTCNRELCDGGDRSCRHVELDILDKDSTYETGDHVAICPENGAEQVEALAQRINADLDAWVSLTDRDGLAPFPCPCTVRDALTKYLDINGAPRRVLLVALAEMASAAGETFFSTHQRARAYTHTHTHTHLHQPWTRSRT